VHGYSKELETKPLLTVLPATSGGFRRLVYKRWTPIGEVKVHCSVAESEVLPMLYIHTDEGLFATVDLLELIEEAIEETVVQVRKFRAERETSACGEEKESKA